MKRIIKAGQPAAYTQWRNRMKGQPNERYPVPNPPREDLVNTLLSEQGFLCGYTMRRIDEETFHIEHIKPEWVCREELKGSDLDYENMIACFPKKTERNKTNYSYGAIYKDRWWEDNGLQFISPLNPNCETQFNCNLKGEIIHTSNNAKKTIEVLKLDHSSLTEDRKRSIETFIYGPKGDDPININKTKQAIEDIISKSKSGEFIEFCIAIRHALQLHLNNLHKAAQKRKFIAQSKKK
jgi:uncharacterized protein (TIGR02646 family)